MVFWVFKTFAEVHTNGLLIIFYACPFRPSKYPIDKYPIDMFW